MKNLRFLLAGVLCIVAIVAAGSLKAQPGPPMGTGGPPQPCNFTMSGLSITAGAIDHQLYVSGNFDTSFPGSQWKISLLACPADSAGVEGEWSEIGVDTISSDIGAHASFVVSGSPPATSYAIHYKVKVIRGCDNTVAATSDTGNYIPS
jgi:hypothetical protein